MSLSSRSVRAVSAPAKLAGFRPVSVTTALIGINLAAFAWESFSRVDYDSGASLVDHGALYGAAVTQDGQWWRIVTAAFLHFGLPHLALNMLALLQIGRAVEAGFGHWRMLAIYALSLVGSGLAVVYFQPESPTLGASGAVFGLFGAVLAMGLRMGARGRPLIGQIAPILVINLIFTFAIPFISKAGHVGGVVSGFLAGLALFVVRPQPPAPVVVDAATGEHREAELLEPEASETAAGPPPAV